MKKTIVMGLTMMLVLFPVMNILYAGGCGGMASGMMGHGGGMMGQGDMGSQSGHEHGGGAMGGEEMGSHSSHQHGEGQQGEPLTRDQAKDLLEDHMKSRQDPNLELGEISEGRDYFEAEIITKDGALVDRVRVDKHTGSLESASPANPNVQESENPEVHQEHVH